MPYAIATKTAKPANDSQLAFLMSLWAEREDFGYDPTQSYTSWQASRLIDAGKVARRKGLVVLEPGYYVTADKTVFQVVRSKSNPERTYAKRLTFRSKGQASWDYVPGGMRDLVGLDILTLTEASVMGRQFGVCVVCAKTLTDPKSVAAGIGPVCGKRLTRQTVDAWVDQEPIRVKATVGGVVRALPAGESIIDQMNPSHHSCEAMDGECCAPEYDDGIPF